MKFLDFGAGHRGSVVTLADVIDPTRIIKKPSLLPKLLPSENSIIEVKSKRSYNGFTLEIFEMNQ